MNSPQWYGPDNPPTEPGMYYWKEKHPNFCCPVPGLYLFPKEDESFKPPSGREWKLYGPIPDALTLD